MRLCVHFESMFRIYAFNVCMQVFVNGVKSIVRIVVVILCVWEYLYKIPHAFTCNSRVCDCYCNFVCRDMNESLP